MFTKGVKPSWSALSTNAYELGNYHNLIRQTLAMAVVMDIRGHRIGDKKTDEECTQNMVTFK